MTYTRIEVKYSILDSIVGPAGLGSPSSIPSWAKTLSFATPFLVSVLNIKQRRPSHRVAFSMGRTSQAEILLIMRPGKPSVNDSVGQFQQTSDTGQDMKEERKINTRAPAYLRVILTVISLSFGSSHRGQYRPGQCAAADTSNLEPSTQQ